MRCETVGAVAVPLDTAGPPPCRVEGRACGSVAPDDSDPPDGGGALDDGSALAATEAALSPANQPSVASRAALLRDKVARRREAMKRDLEEHRAADETSKERWSGLRIEARCIRQEKWDNAMRGKELVPFNGLAGLRPRGGDQVVIGVLCAQPSGPKLDPCGGASCAEWTFTDLNKGGPLKATLVLIDRALKHWACADGPGFTQVKVGSIFGILNPAATARAGAMRVSVESQVLKLGSCPSFARCPAKLPSGLACNAPYNADDGAEFCAYHAGMSVWARCNEQSGRGSLHSRKRERTATPTSIATSRSLAGASPPRMKASHLARQCDRVAEPSRQDAAGSDTKGGTREALTLPEGAKRARDLVLRGAASSKAHELVLALRELDTLDDACSAELAQDPAYAALGVLASCPGAPGALAKKLRRRWRLLADGAT